MSAYERNSYAENPEEIPLGYESALPYWHEIPIDGGMVSTIGKEMSIERTEVVLPLINPIPPMDFDTQFASRELLHRKKDSGAEIAIVDVRPEIAKTPVPLLLAPGFAEGPLTLEPNMRYFSGWGRRVVTYDAPYGVEVEKVPMPTANEGEQFAAYEMGKARTIELVMKQRGITKTDAVGHSEGCINLVIAALKNPEKFRNLILVNPGGMVGNTKLEDLAGRIYSHFINEKKALKENKIMREMRESSAHERTHNLMSHPRRTIEAARAIACSEINGLLRELKGRGIGISIIHGVDDAIFPMDKIGKLAQNDQFDGFYAVRGGHNDFFLNPEPYSMLVDHALDALEAKQKKMAERELEESYRMGR